MNLLTNRPGIQVAAIQLNSQQDITANLSAIRASVTQAYQQGAQLVVLPENACSMGQQHQTAEQFDYLSQQFAKMAAHHNIYLVAGTLPCPYRPDGTKIADGRLRQVSQVFAPDGERVARYDKIHLFTATVSDSQGQYNEAATFEPGSQTVVAPLYIAGHTYHLGLMVCFDLRFPALAQRLREAGADILTAPSAFTYLTGQAHWQLLLRARGLDSQCMIIGAAQGGDHLYSDGVVRQTWGHTTITNHDGSCLNQYAHTELGHDTDPRSELTVEANHQFAQVIANFDPEAQQNARQQLPTFQCHRLA